MKLWKSMQYRTRSHLLIEVSEKQRSEIGKADSLANLSISHGKNQSRTEISGNSGKFRKLNNIRLIHKIHPVTVIA